ncbi:MAG TPA: Gfo/Idh/MocA family oxidoreductase, partial [Salinimicrobium sp.]|nr:Gfo/Idh/MocA family oxidoreductase [Salinimicrobium sp.]
MLKAGVVGAGHLGKIHLKLLQQSQKYHLVGFYDVNKEYGKQVEKETQFKYFSDLDDLIEKVDVVDVVTPTLSHFDVGRKAITAGKHLFIEKPVTSTFEEALDLIKLAKKYNVKGQVGHVERFNPAFQAVAGKIENPMFIECHRLA